MLPSVGAPAGLAWQEGILDLPVFSVLCQYTASQFVFS